MKQAFFATKETELFNLISLFTKSNVFIAQNLIHLCVLLLQVLQFLYFSVNSKYLGWCRENFAFLHDSLPKFVLLDLWSQATAAYVSIAWIVALYTLWLVNLIALKRTRGQVYAILLKPLLLVTMLSNTLFPIPIAHALFSYWKCDGETGCWESSHLFISLLGVVCFGLFLAFGLISSAIVFPNKPVSLAGRVHGRMHILEFLLKIVLTWSYVYIASAAVKLVSLFAVSGSMLYLSLRLLPFLSKKMNSLYSTSWGVALWSVVCASVAELDKSETCDDSANILLYVGFPVVLVVSWLLVQLRFANVAKLPFREVHNAYLLEAKARQLLAETGNGEEAVKRVFEAYKSAVSSYPSALLHYFFARFFAKVKKNHHMAANQQAKAKNMSPAFDVRFFLVLMQKDVSGVAFVVDSESREVFEELLAETQVDAVAALRGQLSFWNQCITEYPDLDVLYRHAKVVHESTQRAENKYMRLFEINPHSTVALRKYSTFLTDVANDEARGHEMMVTADRIVERMSTESDNCDMVSIFESVPIVGGLSLLDDRNAVVTVSTAARDFGSITNVNPCVTKLFGFQSAWLIGNKINLLLPPPLDEQILALLGAFVSSGESSVIDTTRTLLVLHREGHLLPVLCTFHPLTASNGMVLVFRGLEKSRDFLLLAPTGRVIGGTHASLEFLGVVPSALKQSEIFLVKWVKAARKLLDVKWDQLSAGSVMEGMREMDHVVATRQTDAKEVVFKPRKRSARLGERQKADPVSVDVVVNACFFESGAENAAIVLRWDLGGEEDELLSPSPANFTRKVSWAELMQNQVDSDLERSSPRERAVIVQASPDGEEGNRRVRFLMDDDMDEDFVTSPEENVRLLSELSEEEAEEQEHSLEVAAADETTEEEDDVTLQLGRGDAAVAVIMGEEDSRSPAKLENADRVSIARSGTSSRNSSMNTIRNVLLHMHGRDGTVHRLHMVVLAACFFAAILGVFLVINTNGTLTVFEKNVLNIAEAGHRVYHIETIRERCRHISQINSGEDYADEYQVALDRLMEAIVDVELEQDILYNGRDASMHPPELIAMDEVAAIPLVEFTSSGKEVPILANLNEGVRMYASRAKVFHELDASVQIANHSTFRFIYSNAPILTKRAMSATDLYEGVADDLGRDVIDTIDYSYYGVVACIAVILFGIFIPILWRTEKAKDSILSSFLTLSLTDLEVLAEAAEEKLRSKANDEQDEDLMVGEEANRKKHKRHKERATAKFRKSYSRFLYNVGRFAIVVLFILGFFTYVYLVVHSFKGDLSTFTAEVNVAALRMSYLSMSVFAFREMIINGPPACYTWHNETEDALNRMLSLHHDLLYGNATRGLPGSLGRLAARNDHLMKSACGHVSPFAQVPCSEFEEGIMDHGLSAALSHYSQRVSTLLDERFDIPANQTRNSKNYRFMEATLELFKWYLADAVLYASELYQDEVQGLASDNKGLLTLAASLLVAAVGLMYALLLRRVLASIDEDIKLARWMLLQVPYDLMKQNERLLEQVRSLKKE